MEKDPNVPQLMNGYTKCSISHSGILFVHEKKLRANTCYNMDEL